jgi:hypothetical protein
MPAPAAPNDIERFYRAAMVGLGLLEARSAVARRLGADADARWRAFRGALEEWVRIELLVRDAAVANAAGFAPRVVFDLPALAADEPCGPDWPGPEPTVAAELWRSVAGVPAELARALSLVADIWGLRPAPLPAGTIDGIQPATRIVVAGAGAVIGVAAAFAGRSELDFADQCVLIADDAGIRQLFGIAVAYFDTRRPVRIARSGVALEEIRALGVTRIDRAIVSDDLPSDSRGRIEELASALGARG